MLARNNHTRGSQTALQLPQAHRWRQHQHQLKAKLEALMGKVQESIDKFRAIEAARNSTGARTHFLGAIAQLLSGAPSGWSDRQHALWSVAHARQ